MGVNMIYLNAKDINSLIVQSEIIDIIEKGYLQYETGSVCMPDRINIYDGENIFAYMPCFTSEQKGTKILTMHPRNRINNLPPIQGIMLLNDAQNGAVQCILDGATLTANRTGAVGAVGVRHTSGSNCTSLGIIGAGTQGFMQCIYASKVRDIQSVLVLDTDKERAEIFCTYLQDKLPGIEISVCEDSRSLLERAQIIVTTTTSQYPVLPDCKELLHGKHFIGIGSYKPNMREYPRSLFKDLEHVYIDAEYAKLETGDILVPLKEGWLREDQIRYLGQAIATGNINTETTTFFKSVGMSFFDLIVADYLYKKAVTYGIGQKIQA